jgi:hypothetical protein
VSKLNTKELLTTTLLAQHIAYENTKQAKLSFDRPTWLCRYLKKMLPRCTPFAKGIVKKILEGEKTLEREGVWNSAEFQFDTYCLMTFGRRFVHPLTLPIPDEWIFEVKTKAGILAETGLSLDDVFVPR